MFCPQWSTSRRDTVIRPLGRRGAAGPLHYWTKVLWLGVLAGLMVAAFGPAISSAVAASTPTVNLGQASTYAVLSGASVGNTVNGPGAPHTTLRGDLGVKANAQPTGFPPGVVTGTTRIGSTADQAHADLVTAYNEVAARIGGVPLAGDLAGLTLAPGLHSAAAAVSNTGTVTLDGGGDPNAVFVFKIGGALTMAAAARVTLTNGATASRVFWQVNGAAAIGANAKFAGTLMAHAAVAIGAGTEVNGRALARNGAVSLDSNEFYSAPPVVTIAGGSSADTTDTTPTISGTTDLEAPGDVTVTIGGQTLTATPFVDGTWSVDAAILANGTYAVVASVVDGAGNQRSATQQLTVDTVLPVVTLDGGPSDTTNDPTPTIAGTSDVDVGTIVRVTVDSQNLNALVHAGGTWNVTPSALTDGTRTVTASVTDPAGNDGTDSQDLTIDTAAPAVTIGGGATALTKDATPQIAGTADVPPGRTVTVNLADETLTGLVQAGGAWSVTASDLADGPHRVVMSVSDAAGNPASFTQTLTVDTVAPVVTINGGATATTNDLTPTIAGTSDAVAGATVTVAIAGQTMTTLLQPNGTWNATPTSVGVGTWPVVASVPDPAGNTGSAGQALTVASATSPAPGGSGGTGATGSPGAPSAGGGGSISAVTKTTVARDGSQKVRGSSLSIGTKVTAPADGRIVATSSGTVKIKGVSKAIKLTSATATIAAARTATLKLKLKGAKKAAKASFKKVRQATNKGKKVIATIKVMIVDAAGNTRSVTRTVKLTK